MCQRATRLEAASGKRLGGRVLVLARGHAAGAERGDRALELGYAWRRPRRVERHGGGAVTRRARAHGVERVEVVAHSEQLRRVFATTATTAVFATTATTAATTTTTTSHKPTTTSITNPPAQARQPIPTTNNRTQPPPGEVGQHPIPATRHRAASDGGRGRGMRQHSQRATIVAKGRRGGGDCELGRPTRPRRNGQRDSNRRLARRERSRALAGASSATRGCVA